MKALGVSGLPVLVIDHPLGGEETDGVGRRVTQAVDQLTALLRAQQPGRRRRADDAPASRAPRVRSRAEALVLDERTSTPVRRPASGAMGSRSWRHAERVHAMLAAARADGARIARSHAADLARRGRSRSSRSTR